MASGFAWWNMLHNDYLTQNTHVAAGIVGATAIAGASLYYRAKTKPIASRTGDAIFDQELVPPQRFGLLGVIDLIGTFVQGLAKDNIGSKQYKTYLPLLIFVFVWTLVNNLMGMVPGFAAATKSLNTTLAMGLIVFLYYNIQGFREHGFKYLEQYTGHLHGTLLLFLGPLMLVIELISHAVRPMTLGIRLRSNINSEGMVHGIFVDLFMAFANFIGLSIPVIGRVVGFVIEVLGPVPFVVLGLMISVIQSFVFTVLTAIYIGLAVAHEDH